METVTSADGTTIAFDAVGTGPPIVVVTGAFGDRRTPAARAAALAPNFTVFTYDRRGRGDSSDTPPYAPEREIDDLTAVIDAAGGSARVFGHSSGAILALRAAGVGAPIAKLAAYEPPFLVDDTRARMPADLADRVAAALAGGRPGDGIEQFLVEGVGVPAPAVQMMRNGPDWPGMEQNAPTLLYDMAITDRMQMPRELVAAIRIPTLVVAGGDSPEWARNAVAATAAAIPGGRATTLAGQTHGAAPDVLAPVLTEFFASG